MYVFNENYLCLSHMMKYSGKKSMMHKMWEIATPVRWSAQPLHLSNLVIQARNSVRGSGTAIPRVEV